MRVDLSKDISATVYPSHDGGVVLSADTFVKRSGGGNVLMSMSLDGITAAGALMLADMLRDVAMRVLGEASKEDAERQKQINEQVREAA